MIAVQIMVKAAENQIKKEKTRLGGFLSIKASWVLAGLGYLGHSHHFGQVVYGQWCWVESYSQVAVGYCQGYVEELYWNFQHCY